MPRCITDTAAAIRNTLLEADGDSSKQFFTPFKTFMEYFLCCDTSNKQRKSYRLSGRLPRVRAHTHLHTQTKILIICSFDQAINGVHNNVHIR